MSLNGGGDMRTRGLEVIKVALAFDNEGKYPEAVQKYTQGIEFLMASKKYEKNPRTKQMLVGKITEYMNRCETLKTMLSEGTAPAPAPPPSAGATSQAKKPKDGKDGKSADDKETDKMREALSEAIQMETPDVKWEDVAGLETAKNALREAVMMPRDYPQLFRGERKPWRGILLYGPPGTGKSFLAKALASLSMGDEETVTFFSVSSSDLVSKWLGESEKLVRNLFELAREKKPSIIFIDEIDSLCTARSDSESESARRIKTEFLVQMDGVGKDQTGVLLLGATNLPWGLDQAVRRRFEKRIYIPLPDKIARVAMFKIAAAKQAKGGAAVEMTEEDLGYLADHTEGFSGSDIKIVVKQALMEPIQQLMVATHFKQVTAPDIDGNMCADMLVNCKPDEPGARPMRFADVPPPKLAEPPLTSEHFVAVIHDARGSVSQEDLLPFQKWTEQYGQDGSGASGQRGETDVAEFEGGGGGAAGPTHMAAGTTTKSEGLGMLMAQLATCLPNALKVQELEERVQQLEYLLRARGVAAEPEGEPPAQ